MAPPPTAAADAPLFGQGETAENPSPVPKDKRISDRAAATKAPAATAGQDTPEDWASFRPTLENVSETTTGRDDDCAIIIMSPQLST